MIHTHRLGTLISGSMLSLFVACGYDSPATTNASGGKPSAGQTAGGATGSGGTTTNGGTPSSGGKTATSGGAVTSGGQTSMGGSTAAGGSSASGGTIKGGSTSAGGSTGSENSGPCPMDLVGWATEGKGTTGGGNVTPKVVTSSAELKSLAGDGSPQVIHLSGTFSGGFTIASNKTIIGKGTNTVIHGGGVSIRGSNVILRNVIIKGGTDTLNSTESSNMWLDHLDVSDGADGVIDLTRSSTYATVSWNKIYYNRTGSHRLALLFGNGSTYFADKGFNNHTVHHNWFGKGVDQRMPRLLFGKGHIYNNYYNSPGNTYCIGSGSWGTLFVESNYFKDVADPHRFQDGNPSHITAKDNVYINTTGKKDTGAGGSGSDPPGAWTPTYSYKADPAESIPELVQRCAGPQASLLP